MGPRHLTRLLALFCATWASPAWADTVTFRSGEVQTGRVLAMGETRLAFYGDDGPVVLERSALREVLDEQGHPVSPDGEPDPVAVVDTLRNTSGAGVTVRRLGRDLSVSLHGAASVIREGDLLRALPQGKVTLRTRGGASLSARSDALIRFSQELPNLLEGVLEIEQTEGVARARIPEGRIEVSGGRCVLERVNDSTHVRSLAERTVLTADEGYTVTLPRNHALEVCGGSGKRLGSLVASNTNAWSLHLEQNGRFLDIGPGERVVLLGQPTPAPAAPETPAPQAARPPEPQTPAPPPVGPPGPAGQVVRAGAGFTLTRPGEDARRIDPVEAPGLRLLQGDRVETQGGQVELESASTRVRLFAHSALNLARSEGGAPFALSGEATFETSSAVAVALPMGELGLLRGAIAVRSGEGETELSVRQGTAGLRLGDAVRVELLPGATVRAAGSAERVSVEAPPGAPSLGVSLGTLDLQLEAGQRVSYAATGGVQRIGLWNQAQLELVGPVRCELIAAEAEGVAVALADGRHFTLRPGSRTTFTQEGDQVLAGDQALAAPAASPTPAPTVEPAPQPQAAAPSPSPAAPPPQLAHDGERQTLPNGAVLVAKGWSKDQVELGRQEGDRVEVTLPGGNAWLEPGTELHVIHGADGARLATTDGRYVIHEPEGEPFELTLERDQTLRIQVGREATRRWVEVEPGCAFDLLIRRGYARAFVSGQVKYVEPGERISVGQTTGLRTQLAKQRGER